MNQNTHQNGNAPDRMTDYLQNQRPSVIVNSNNEEIIIPPLNTDIRFNAYRSSGGSSQESPFVQQKPSQSKPYSQNIDFNNAFGAGSGGKRKNNFP